MSKSASGRVTATKTYASIVSNKEDVPTPRFFHVESEHHHTGGRMQQLPTEFDNNGELIESEHHHIGGRMQQLPTEFDNNGKLIGSVLDRVLATPGEAARH